MSPLFGRRRKPVHRYGAHQVAIALVEESVKQLVAKLDTWQARVLRYASLIPEVMTGYAFVHNTMDLVTFEIQRFDRHANEWVCDESPEIQGIERRINIAFKAGRAAALGHLVEEAYLLVTRTADNDFHFETLGPTEIQSKQAVVQRRQMVNGERHVWVDLDCETTVIRIYTPDPEDRHRASGPHKPLLGLLETMALELSRDQADSISVLAGNGILYIPTEILPDEVDTLDASETPGSRRGFEAALEDAMVATITDRSKGEAVVPITLYGPAEHANAIRHILPTRPDGAKESSDRMAAYISRYAHSIDLPAQVITGMGDSNHWSDWKVDENTWAYHLRPRGQRIADAIYAGLVRHIICNLGHNPDEFRLVPNATRAIAKTDISRTAIDVYKLGAITPEALIEATGFDPSDMRPDAEEALLALVSSGPDDDQYLNRTQPERTAASSNPAVILRQASRVANAHQTKLETMFRRMLGTVAEDAARAGRKSGKADKTAAGRPKFEGYEPGVYFAKYAEQLATATADELFAFLKRVATLTGLDYRALRTVWATEFEQRAQQVVRQAELAAESVAKRSYESGKPMRVADNTIRTLSSTANGGSNENNGGAGNTKRPTDAGADPAIRDALTEVVGAYATRYEWVVGHPMKPYPPHQALAGRTWFSWQEFDKLDVPDSQNWLLGSVFFPGDHDGCQCSYNIEFVPITEAT